VKFQKTGNKLCCNIYLQIILFALFIPFLYGRVTRMTFGFSNNEEQGLIGTRVINNS